MSSTRRRVRSRRTGPVVAVVGAAGRTGSAVAAALQALVGEGVSSVIALDDTRGAVDGVTWRLGPTGDPGVATRLRGAEVVVLVLAPDDLAATLAEAPLARRERVVREVQAVVTAAAAVGARKVVAVTSAMAYGARPDNPVPLPEDAALLAVPDSGVVGDLVEAERVLERVPRVHPGLRVAVVRPAALVGPGVDTVVTRHFEAPRLLAVRDATPAWQFCHVEDVATAVARVVTADLEGSVGVGCPGTLTQADVERVSGMRRVELPASLAFGTAERLHRVGVLPAPATDLAFVVHPWAVSTDRLTEAGWTAAYDNETCLGVLLEEVQGHYAVAARRLDRRDAALGAAGAAVALVGTAALVRRRRRREGSA